MIDIIIHIDVHLAEVIQSYGMCTYLILFIIIFCETGLVVTPFLPGDSLLFVIGALGAVGALDFNLVIVLLIIAAITGNSLNYYIGSVIGKRVLERPDNRFVKKKYIEKAQLFYEKHGGKAILLSRFLPILRTFAPFVAGIGKMSFARFTAFNIAGAVSWVLIFSLGGYFFGNIPVVKSNFTLLISGIIIVSLLPAVITGINARREKIRLLSEEDHQ